MRRYFYLCLTLCYSILLTQAFAQSNLQLSPAPLSDLKLQVNADGTFEINTTGGDPFLYTTALPEGTDLNTNHILAFEYFSLTGIGDVQVFLTPPTQEKYSVHGDSMPKSEVWSKYTIDLKPALDKLDAPIESLRIDLGRRANRNIKIRNIHLRAKTARERELEARVIAAKEVERKLDQEISDYLSADFPCAITLIESGDTGISISGTVNKERGDFYLAEIPLHEDITTLTSFSTLHPIDPKRKGKFDLTLAKPTEHLLSRWVIVRKANDAFEKLSHARYIDTQTARWEYPEELPHNRKGLGGFSPHRPVSDIKDLDISAVTVNIILHQYLRTQPANGHSPREYGGRTWYVNDAAIARLDASLRDAAQRKLIVSVILLLPQRGNAKPDEFRYLIAHPDADPAGIYVMPNLTSAEGVNAYAAVIDLLAERYGRADKEFGRIHHWIIHNEVNSGWVWTNMGAKTATRYMDMYHKSMRLTHLIARQYNPHARTFISLEHNWTSTHNDKCHTGRELMDLLIDFSRAEGDFEWSLAYHPYPQDLGNPRTWEDVDATYSFDTPLITFKNIEVIDAWMRQPKALYQGKHLRDIQFTEQAPNSPQYTEASLNEQAAAMAYLWKKLEVLDSISMFHVHNWVDNRHEGGLRIGLRKYPDDKDDPHGKKPVWYTFQALETPEQEAFIEKYKAIIGIDEWDEVIYTDEIK